MRFYKRVWFWAVIVVIVIVALIFFKKSSDFIEVKTKKVIRQNLEITVQPTGTGTVKVEKEFRISAERIGRIKRLFVEEGAVVKAGTPIAELDTEEVEANLAMARASYERATAFLSQMKSAFESLKIETESRIKRAKSTLKEIESRRQRILALKEKGFVSQMELDAVERDYDLAMSNYDSAVSSRRDLEAKTQEIMGQEASVKEAKKAVEIAEMNYQYSFIKSPFAGVVSSRPVKVGDTVMKGAVIASVMETGSLYIEVFVDEVDIEKVKIGQMAHITMDAYANKPFEGVVYMMSPVVFGTKHEARTFEVRTRLKEKTLPLKPGMSADVEIVVNTIPNALLLPSQAVVEKDGTSFVYVKDGGIARNATIKQGQSNWTFTQVINGVSEGQEVIINPEVQGLKDGVKVKISVANNRN